eukprot:3579878-Ditylum_brightwellii.AAC.1
MKSFQFQGLTNHPSVVEMCFLFLVANSEIGKANKLEAEIKELKSTIKALAADVKIQTVKLTLWSPRQIKFWLNEAESNLAALVTSKLRMILIML